MGAKDSSAKQGCEEDLMEGTLSRLGAEVCIMWIAGHRTPQVQENSLCQSLKVGESPADQRPARKPRWMTHSK